MKNIILASASPRRKELLEQIGVNFQIVSSNTDEHIEFANDPVEYACTLSGKKAMDVAKRYDSGYLVIGADTIVVLDGKILGKPEDKEDAFRMLKSLQGKWHEVITGVTVIDAGDKRAESDYEKTRVKMRSLSDDMIKAYINTGEPMDKAGSYGIQRFGALLVERIEGCYFNVVGLPLVKLSFMLEKFGYTILS
ncbi:MAG TPA: septum formation inhibitor Maf [Clostridiaceae bacterium]|jgi:septum formation protein|nr:septum formation inhibitor Maf [Clostridiaceae bacterium]